MVTPVGKRDAVAHACKEHGVSQRRACVILQVDRSSVRYKSIRGDDAGLREAKKKVAAKRRRFGYRRIAVMLARQGIHMNHKKLRRLYQEEKLQVRKRPSRRRSACLPVNGGAANRLWAQERLLPCRARPMRDGLLISSRTPSRMVVASECWLSLMISPVNVWHWWWTHHCLAIEWSANWMN